MKVNYAELQPRNKYVIQNKNQTKIGEFINRYDTYSCAYFKIFVDGGNDYYYAYIDNKSNFYKFFESVRSNSDESPEKICNIIDVYDFLSLSY